MGWYITNHYTFTGDNGTIERMESFFKGLIPEGETEGRLRDLRDALYTNRRRKDNNGAFFCPGKFHAIRTGGRLTVCINTWKGFFEGKTFIRTLRRRFGRFHFAVLVDDSEFIEDKWLWTNDRTGRIFPHFTLLEGDPEHFERWPYIDCNPPFQDGTDAETLVKEKQVANVADLLRELRERGLKVRTYKEFVKEHPDLLVRNPDGTKAVGLWPVNHPGCTTPFPF